MTAGASKRPETQSARLRQIDDGPHLVVDLTENDTSQRRELDRRLLVGDTGLLAASHIKLRKKRTADIVGSSICLVVLLPILLAAAIAVVVTSPGPPVFRQERIGRNGRPFNLYKFRSMRRSAEEERDKLGHINEASGPVFKIKEDPRITRLGRFLRRSSIDELPQLWNVLRGDMSLVGPRPPLPEEVAEYSDWERQRLLVKPGITCIWQVSGRSEIDFETWVQMDIDYINRWSPKLDLELLARTIPAVLTGRGAY